MAGDHEGSGSQPLRLLTSEHKPIANTNTYISLNHCVHLSYKGSVRHLAQKPGISPVNSKFM